MLTKLTYNVRPISYASQPATSKLRHMTLCAVCNFASEVAPWSNTQLLRPKLCTNTFARSLGTPCLVSRSDNKVKENIELYNAIEKTLKKKKGLNPISSYLFNTPKFRIFFWTIAQAINANRFLILLAFVRLCLHTQTRIL